MKRPNSHGKENSYISATPKEKKPKRRQEPAKTETHQRTNSNFRERLGASSETISADEDYFRALTEFTGKIGLVIEKIFSYVETQITAREKSEFSRQSNLAEGKNIYDEGGIRVVITKVDGFGEDAEIKLYEELTRISNQELRKQIDSILHVYKRSKKHPEEEIDARRMDTTGKEKIIKYRNLEVYVWDEIEEILRDLKGKNEYKEIKKMLKELRDNTKYGANKKIVAYMKYILATRLLDVAVVKPRYKTMGARESLKKGKEYNRI